MKLTESTQKELTDALLQKDRDVNMFIEKLRRRANNLKLTVKPEEKTVESIMNEVKQEIEDSKRIDLSNLVFDGDAGYDCYSMAHQLRAVGYNDAVIKTAVFEFWLNRKPNFTEC